MSTAKRTAPRRVDFFLFKEDYECAYLGALGFSTRYIEQRTGLTPGKVTYRLKKATIKRVDYRNGESIYARIIINNLRPTLQNELTHYLKTGVVK